MPAATSGIGRLQPSFRQAAGIEPPLYPSGSRRSNRYQCQQASPPSSTARRSFFALCPFGVRFPRQYNFRLRHLFALVMHVFVETVVGFPLKFLCFVPFTVACHAAVSAHPHQEWMPRCVPFAQVVNAIVFAVNNMDKALFFRGVVLRGDVHHAQAKLVQVRHRERAYRRMVCRG